jgi:hypothetical protein
MHATLTAVHYCWFWNLQRIRILIVAAAYNLCLTQRMAAD